MSHGERTTRPAYSNGSALEAGASRHATRPAEDRRAAARLRLYSAVNVAVRACLSFARIAPLAAAPRSLSCPPRARSQRPAREDPRRRAQSPRRRARRRGGELGLAAPGPGGRRRAARTVQATTTPTSATRPARRARSSSAPPGFRRSMRLRSRTACSTRRSPGCPSIARRASSELVSRLRLRDVDVLVLPYGSAFPARSVAAHPRLLATRRRARGARRRAVPRAGALGHGRRGGVGSRSAPDVLRARSPDRPRGAGRAARRTATTKLAHRRRRRQRLLGRVSRSGDDVGAHASPRDEQGHAGRARLGRAARRRRAAARPRARRRAAHRADVRCSRSITIAATPPARAGSSRRATHASTRPSCVRSSPARSRARPSCAASRSARRSSRAIRRRSA